MPRRAAPAVACDNRAPYRIRFGDGLRAIALHAYGHADREDIIMQANPIIVDHNRIYEGQVILLPPASAAPAAQTSPGA